MTTTAGLMPLLTAALLAASLLGIVTLAGALATHALWAHAPYLAPAYGLLPVGLAGTVTFFAWVLDPTAGRLCAVLAVALSLAVVIVQGLRLHRDGALAPLFPSAARLAAVALGLLVLSLGLLLLWGAPADLFYATRERFSHALPNDNELPSIIAARLLAGSDPRVPINSWLSSDRPPLQTGLLLLVQGDSGWAPIPALTRSFAASVVCQFSWVPAVYALSRSLRLSPRAALGGVVFAGLSGTILVNTVFTWPKLLSAGFVIAAIALAVDLHGREVRGRTTTVAIAGLAVFGLLSHGAAFFAFPVLAIALWWARRSLSLSGLAAGGVLAAACYSPWLVYQRLYDPPGDRLLKWHLAGVTEVDDRSFLTALVTAYRDLPFGTLVRNKVENLVVPLGLDSPADLRSLDLLAALRAEQFYSIAGAVGLALLPMVLLLVTAARHRREHPGTPVTRSAGLLLAAGVALVMWCLLLFGPGTTWVHSGTHVPIILATCLPVAWSIDRRPGWAAALGGAQLALLALLYVPHNYPGFPAAFSQRATVTVLVALGLLACVLWTARPAAAGTEKERTGRPIEGRDTGRVSLRPGPLPPVPAVPQPAGTAAAPGR